MKRNAHKPLVLDNFLLPFLFYFVGASPTYICCPRTSTTSDSDPYLESHKILLFEFWSVSMENLTLSSAPSDIVYWSLLMVLLAMIYGFVPVASKFYCAKLCLCR